MCFIGPVIGRLRGLGGDGSPPAVEEDLQRSGGESPAGASFTVSLLIGGLAYPDPSQFERVTTAVLIASVLASAAAAVVFRRRVCAARPC